MNDVENSNSHALSTPLRSSRDSFSATRSSTGLEHLGGGILKITATSMQYLFLAFSPLFVLVIVTTDAMLGPIRKRCTPYPTRDCAS